VLYIAVIQKFKISSTQTLHVFAGEMELGGIGDGNTGFPKNPGSVP